MKHYFCLAVLGLPLMLALSLSGPAAHAQTYVEQTLHNFQNSASDGQSPTVGLLDVDSHGSEKFYGTTPVGGANNHGCIYSIDPISHVVTILYSFKDTTTDGGDPQTSLINIGGTLYGTTDSGGAGGGGTLFAINTDGTGYQVLYSFSGGDGAYPTSTLITDGSTLFGTTEQGGNGIGTVFSFNLTTHHLKTLYSFQTITGEGSYPEGGLIEVGGVLIGTTISGGLNSGSSNGFGTIFSINTDGTNFKTLYKFAGRPNDGEEPNATLTSVNGTIYGTTTAGGSKNDGTVFSFDVTTGTDKILHSFLGGSDGIDAYSSLLNIGGILYGSTDSGAPSNNGMVYSINPDGTGYQSRYNFTDTQTGQINSDGGFTHATLIDVGGTLYGTAENLGANAFGTIFALTPSTATAPSAHNDSGKTFYNTTLTINAPGLLGNDNNGGSGPLTAALVTNPTHGTITFHSDGSFTYVPATGYLGADSFTYKDTNPIGTSNIATCTLTVQARSPFAANDSARTAFNTPLVITAPGVLGNDRNGDNNPMTARLVSQPSHGSIIFNSDGSFKYTPTNGFLGSDSFTYQAVNDVGPSDTTICTILVQARTPVANNDAGRLTHNHTLTITAPGVLGNDNPGDTGTITTTLVTGPTHGTITFHTDGSFVYTPTTGFIGTDSFTYKDTNAIGTSNTATCTLTVQ